MCEILKACYTYKNVMKSAKRKVVYQQQNDVVNPLKIEKRGKSFSAHIQ